MKWHHPAKKLARISLALLAALLSTQCVLYRQIKVAYQPSLQAPKDADPKLPPVTVTVRDNRPTDVVGHPLGFIGEKEGNVTSGEQGRDFVTRTIQNVGHSMGLLSEETGETGSGEEVPDTLKRAFEIDLRDQGYTIAPGGNDVIVVLGFLDSQYTHPLFWTRAVASTGLDVTVKRANGTVVYNTFILGQSEGGAEIHFESTEPTLSDAVNAAMANAINKTFADPLFLEALKRK